MIPAQVLQIPVKIITYSMDPIVLFKKQKVFVVTVSCVSPICCCYHHKGGGNVIIGFCLVFSLKNYYICSKFSQYADLSLTLN